jgi:hypothetical protein
MAFARKYEYFEVRHMLQAAEGVDSPVTQQPAHSRVLHAMGGGGTGATLGNMLDRVTKRPGESGNQFKKRGAGATGAFTTQLQQGSAACEALNSRFGQDALAWFDDVEYQGFGLRLVLTAPISRQLGFLPASGAPSAYAVKKGDAAVTKAANTSGVKLIIDRAANGNTMHIQTCYPLNGAAPVAEWDVTDMSGRTVVAWSTD